MRSTNPKEDILYDRLEPNQTKPKPKPNPKVLIDRHIEYRIDTSRTVTDIVAVVISYFLINWDLGGEKGTNRKDNKRKNLTRGCVVVQEGKENQPTSDCVKTCTTYCSSLAAVILVRIIQFLLDITVKALGANFKQAPIPSSIKFQKGYYIT